MGYTPSSLPGKDSFSDYLNAVKQTMKSDPSGKFGAHKVTLAGNKSLNFKEAVQGMTETFEKLSSSEQKTQLNDLKEQITYLKNNIDTNEIENKTILTVVDLFQKSIDTLPPGPELNQAPPLAPTPPPPPAPMMKQATPPKQGAPSTSVNYKIPPDTEYAFTYNWGFQSHNVDPEVIKSASPEKLLGMAAQGAKITGEEFLLAAEKFRATLPALTQGREQALTTLHQLYSKASENFAAEGDLDKAFHAKSLAAEHTLPSSSSPLYKMGEAIESGQNAQRSKMFGAHFSGLDTGKVKGGSVRGFNRKIDNEEMIQMEFKLSKFARHDLQKQLIDIQNNQAAFEASLPAELKGKVRITRVPDAFVGKNPTGSFDADSGYCPGSKNVGAKALQFEFEGVGTVLIGNTPTYGCLYNNVKVLVKAGQPEGKAQAQIHQMLTMLGVGPVMNSQRPQDDERMKMAQIFRAYMPKEAIKMERTKEFYELPTEELGKKIVEDFPEMAALFEKYKNNPQLIQKVENYNGKSVWALTDISLQMKANGAFGLMAGVGKANDTDGAAATIALIVKNGGMASQDRFQAGLFAKGASSETDLKSGGGDHVFTRLINEKLKDTSLETWNFPWQGEFQVLYDLDAVNTGAYAFRSDKYGVRKPSDPDYEEYYANRANLIDFAGEVSERANEVMVNNYIPPTLIRGIVCQTQTQKDTLINKLTSENIIVNGMMNGKPADQFIHVALNFKKEMWDK